MFPLRKRLLTLILTGVAVPLLQGFGVPDDTIQWVIGLAMTYILGQSASDVVAIKSGSKEN
jgi:hypothetical protein